MKIACAICQKKVEWEDNPYRPFCSERCKLVDLGHWAEGSYRVSEAAVEDAPESES